jgi:hypothetical protein
MQFLTCMPALTSVWPCYGPQVSAGELAAAVTLALTEVLRCANRYQKWQAC